MARWGMVIDLKRCVGCHSCTIACKAENGTPPDIFFTRVMEDEVGTHPQATRQFVPVLCNHCREAPCVEVCPTGASYHTPEGVVLVDKEVCVGCRACYVACPYNNRFYLDDGVLETGYFGTLTPFEKYKYAAYEAGTVVKCTFCYHRLQEGLEPACVATCPAGARVFGDLDDPASKVNVLVRQRRGYQPLAELGTDPSVFYLD